jgi:putative vitamin uptake transporter
LTAYLVGEFANSFVLAKLKIATKGHWLWTRTIGSTFVGEGLDTLIFISIAFWGIIPSPLLLMAILTQWLFKVLYEVGFILTSVEQCLFATKKRERGESKKQGNRRNAQRLDAPSRVLKNQTTQHVALSRATGRDGHDRTVAASEI